MGNEIFYTGKEILILGGTGSLGRALLKRLEDYSVKGIRIYSRDEYKQWALKKELAESGYGRPVAFLIGDVRNKDRLVRAFSGVDIVINCAAMKHVEACELNPIEAVETNVFGAINIIAAALEANVERVLHVSTDKAVYPVNLYGATKATAEKLFLDSSIYSGRIFKTIFSCVRYGNVFGSRGSFVELLRKNPERVCVTDPEMTRFFIQLKTVAEFIVNEIVPSVKSGHLYIPTMKAIKITDLVAALAPGAAVDIIGAQQGEKIHECLISGEEACHSKFVQGFQPFMVVHQSINEPSNGSVTSKNAAIYSPLTKEEVKTWE